MDPARALRIAGVFATAWTVLYLRFSAGLFTPTEVDPMVHWALLPIALLIGVATAAMEVNRSASVPRRDTMFGLSSALASFAVLHAFKLV